MNAPNHTELPASQSFGVSRELVAPPPRPPEQSISDWIHGVVRRDIIEGRLHSEEVLVEGILAKRFGVSRGPAREALQRLVRSDLVRVVPRLGYIVTSVSLRDYDEIFQMRLSLEPLATEIASRRIAENLVNPKRLVELSVNGENLLNESIRDGGASMARRNHEFHLEIARLSGNRRLERIIDRLLADLDRVLAALTYSPGALRPMWDDHPNLAIAMKDGPPARARDLMHTELVRARDLMRELVLSGELTINGNRR